ncbi:MAG TPA: hypothetical protein VN804_06550 [Solirubrobacteraceae bacterium]|jgi:hypothetical protein|nr:hypothetical protein [Solirubrobacteraceae bacterium]
MAPSRKKDTLIGAAVLPFLPQLSSLEFVIVVGLVAVWMAPNWLYKLLLLAEALRRFRDRWSQKPDRQR